MIHGNITSTPSAASCLNICKTADACKVMVVWQSISVVIVVKVELTHGRWQARAILIINAEGFTMGMVHGSFHYYCDGLLDFRGAPNRNMCLDL